MAAAVGGSIVSSALAQEELGGSLMNARPFGAKGDGKTDDTAAIQKAIDTAAAHGGAVFLPPAT